MTYVVSDIHARYDLFMRLLDGIGFSDGDTLISCGDVIDKGNESVRLLRFIRDMRNARCIMGNHEHSFIKYAWALLKQSNGDWQGALAKLRQYFPNDGGLLEWEDVFWLMELPYFIEEEKFICVHAGIPLDGNGRIIPPALASKEVLVNDRKFKDPKLEVLDSKCVFFGHTPTSYITPDSSSRVIAYRRRGAPKDSYNITDFYKIHLDTGTWIDGVLGCFCVENCNVYYAKKY